MSDLRDALEKLPDRFWAKVEKTDTCWLWTGSLSGGYGAFAVGRRSERAHRVAYRALVGQIPEGLVLDHLCRVRNCVNPEHLEPKTNRANILADGATGASARNSRKTHCPRKHALSGANLLPRETRRGGRSCRACARASNLARQKSMQGFTFQQIADQCYQDLRATYTLRTASAKIRFWDKVALPDENGCMPWLGAKDKLGRGQFSVSGKMVKAHRFSYSLAGGTVGADDQIGRTCGTPSCVSPEHLQSLATARAREAS